MTAEVAVLNKLAVALAADSATTINIIGQNRPKIYTAQKLFPLVRNQPVGVMIYSNAEFVGIPWETIIKMYYQSTEGRAPLGTVEEYLYDLLGFLTKHPIRTDAREERHILEIAGRVLAEVQSDLNAIDDLAERTSALTEIIDKLIDENESLGIDESISEVDVDGVVEGHQDSLNRRIASAFRHYDLTDDLRQSLQKLIGSAIRAPTTRRTPYSGVVVAGFGDDEVLPSMASTAVMGLVGGKTKYTLVNLSSLSETGNTTLVTAFAQREMVNRFIEGVDPDFIDYLGKAVSESSARFAIETLESAGISLNEDQKQKITSNAQGLARKYMDQTKRMRHDKFVRPTVSAVQHLHKEELAGMAESLVSLTALKQRVSHDPETVGGPIDVAVISKGDGFVWIRRQHYVDPDLNRITIANY